MWSRRRTRLLTVVLTAVSLGSGLLAQSGEAAVSRSSTWVMLRGLPVVSEHPVAAGAATAVGWVDADRDGCSTRQEVLLRDAVVAPRRGPRCLLRGGTWRLRYDGASAVGARHLQVERLVPLREAWASGGWRWSRLRQRAFANDLGYRGSLLVASTPVARARGDQEPQQWLPARTSSSCSYLAHWVAVKWRWHLSVDAAERRYLAAELAACGWPRVRRPRTPPMPVVKGLASVGRAPTSMTVPCGVRSSETAAVNVRFAAVGSTVHAWSRAVTMPPGRRTVPVRLSRLRPSTTYELLCRVRTATAGLVPAASPVQAKTLAAAPVATGPVATAPVARTSIAPTLSDQAPPATPGTTTVAATPSAPETTPPEPPPPAGTTVVAVGDLCATDHTTCDATGTLAESLSPRLFMVLGDTQYLSATQAEYDAGYRQSTWDAVNALTYPAIGNHEVRLDPDAAPYCAYFVNAHCSGAARWYAYDVDADWRAIVLDSNDPSSSAQLAWLDGELSRVGTSRNLLVYWHHPRWVNSAASATNDVDPLLQRIYAAHADIVLWGHDHLYARFGKISPTGLDPVGGMRAFTVGTGGAPLRDSLASPLPDVTEKALLTQGVLELTLRATSYSWVFHSVDGRVLDSGADDVTP